MKKNEESQDVKDIKEVAVFTALHKQGNVIEDHDQHDAHKDSVNKSF